MKFHRFVLNARRTGLALIIAVATALSSQLMAQADNQMAIPPQSQQDGTWSGARLGTSPTETIGSAGCAITAVAMMLRYFDINTDPAALNAWLTASGGYAFDDQLIWNAVTAYSAGRVTFTNWLGPDLGVIEQELDASHPVIAEVQLAGNMHFVLITGYTAQGGLMINDPWFGDTVPLGARYGGIISIRTFTAPVPSGVRADGRVLWVTNATQSGYLAR